MNVYQGPVGCLILMLLLLNSPVMAQQRQIDSLKAVLTLKLPDTIRAQTYYDVANLFYKQNHPDSALHYLKPMRQICLRVNYWTGLGDFNRLNGIIRMHQGQFEDALTFYQAALTAYTKAGKNKDVAKVYNNLGLLYKMMGDSQGVLAYTRQGLAYVQQAIALNERMGTTQSLRDNYVNLGIIYEDLGNLEQGRACFYKALAPINQMEVLPDVARTIYNNLGKNYNEAGQYQKAVYYLEKSLAINEPLKKYSSLIHNYRNLATAYDGLGQSTKAVQYAEKARVLTRRVNDAPLISSVYSMLAKTYAGAGQYDKAYAAMVQHKRMDDSLVTLAKTRTISQLEGRYAVQQANALATIKANLELAKTQAVAQVEAQKAKEIALIQSEEERREAQIKAAADIEKARAMAELRAKYDTRKKVQQIAELNQRNQQRARQIQYMTGGLGLLLVLLGSLVGQYYVIRRSNRRLSVQNGIIAANSEQLVNQSNQLRVLMKELHHRVKNNLAIVSSLLKLQMNRLDDEKAIQAVRVSQQRVEAMSLIHQRLYQTDQLTTINMAEYLTDLANGLMRAYGYHPDTFDLQLNVDLPELDVDVAIPLGLIVNELATNAFKYAYTTVARPLLRINLHQTGNEERAGMTLEVQDNGPGIDSLDGQRPNQQSSFGRRLILSLSEQLEGEGQWVKQNGTLFRLSIQNARLAA
ncbi:tetratricopeptide repeat-containing sensor histidine kinase [Spirosoma lituiforme]